MIGDGNNTNGLLEEDAKFWQSIQADEASSSLWGGAFEEDKASSKIYQSIISSSQPPTLVTTTDTNQNFIPTTSDENTYSNHSTIMAAPTRIHASQNRAEPAPYASSPGCLDQLRISEAFFNSLSPTLYNLKPNPKIEIYNSHQSQHQDSQTRRSSSQSNYGNRPHNPQQPFNPNQYPQYNSPYKSPYYLQQERPLFVRNIINYGPLLLVPPQYYQLIAYPNSTSSNRYNSGEQRSYAKDSLSSTWSPPTFSISRIDSQQAFQTENSHGNATKHSHYVSNSEIPSTLHTTTSGSRELKTSLDSLVDTENTNPSQSSESSPQKTKVAEENTKTQEEKSLTTSAPESKASEAKEKVLIPDPENTLETKLDPTLESDTNPKKLDSLLISLARELYNSFSSNSNSPKKNTEEEAAEVVTERKPLPVLIPNLQATLPSNAPHPIEAIHAASKQNALKGTPSSTDITR